MFLVEGRWYRINSGFISQDEDTGEWVLNKNLVYGVGLKEGELKLVHFKKNIFDNVPVASSALPEKLVAKVRQLPHTLTAKNKEVVKKLNLEEELGSGIYKKPSEENSIKGIKRGYNFQVGYGFEDSGDLALKELQYAIAEDTGVKKLANDISIPSSFGWEFETTDGFIPERVLIPAGLIPLRDGSISGYEYTTIPLKGYQGIQTTFRALDALKKYTTTNRDCALHLHLGTLPESEEFLRAAYSTCVNVQDEIYSMFPSALAHTAAYKSRDYCNKLSGNTERRLGLATVIDQVAGMGGYFSESYSGLGEDTHPLDRDGNRKWQVSPRYVWANFVPYIFSRRGTVEFRIHTPSVNPAKVINWLLICSALVEYAKKYTESEPVHAPFQNLTLKMIMEEIYSEKVAQYLNAYINYRKVFINECTEMGDLFGDIDIRTDETFVFPFELKETILS